jgi:hypothetical protein
LPNFVQPIPSLRALVRQYRRILVGVMSIPRELDWFHVSTGAPKPVAISRFAGLCRSYHDGCRFLMSVSAAALTAIQYGWRPAAGVAAGLYLLTGVIALHYRGLSLRIRRVFAAPLPARHGSLSIVLGTPFFFGPFGLVMLADYACQMIVRQRAVLEIASDKTERA